MSAMLISSIDTMAIESRQQVEELKAVCRDDDVETDASGDVEELSSDSDCESSVEESPAMLLIAPEAPAEGEEDAYNGMFEPWEWLEDDAEDAETREYVRKFSAEVKASYSAPKVQSREIDKELLAMVASPPASPKMQPAPPAATPGRAFVRRRHSEAPAEAPLVVMAGHAGRSLRRAGVGSC